ncbi:hypothetical protein K1719_029058 [Acacia pycnantha]|nr:hypothetical protein K1719_029058 [Acacia pycnantha]
MPIDHFGLVAMVRYSSRPSLPCTNKLTISLLPLRNPFAGQSQCTNTTSLLIPSMRFRLVRKQNDHIVLNKLSKTMLPKEMIKFIQDSTANYGKVKLVLKKNRYFIESPFPEVLKTLLRDEVISRSRITSESGLV